MSRDVLFSSLLFSCHLLLYSGYLLRNCLPLNLHGALSILKILNLLVNAMSLWRWIWMHIDFSVLIALGFLGNIHFLFGCGCAYAVISCLDVNFKKKYPAWMYTTSYGHILRYIWLYRECTSFLLQKISIITTFWVGDLLSIIWPCLIFTFIIMLLFDNACYCNCLFSVNNGQKNRNVFKQFHGYNA